MSSRKYKARDAGQDVGIASNKDALDVQFDATLVMGINNQLVEPGTEAECGVFVSALSAEVDGQPRFIELSGAILR